MSRWIVSALLLLFGVRAAYAEIDVGFLPDLPYTVGLAGPFVGTHNDALFVAGGANFPHKSLIEGGEKIWHDQMYVFTPGAKQWDTRFKLAAPRAYGASASTRFGMLMIGGGDHERDYAEVALTTWNKEKKTVEQHPLPALPIPLQVCRAVAIGDRVYVMSGKSSAHPDHQFKRFWVMDLSAKKRTWTALKTLPGKPRANPVMAVQKWQGES